MAGEGFNKPIRCFDLKLLLQLFGTSMESTRQPQLWLWLWLWLWLDSCNCQCNAYVAEGFKRHIVLPCSRRALI
jgi:hypothetical protein